MAQWLGSLTTLRGPGFEFQNLHDSLLLPLTWVPGSPASSSGTRRECIAQMYMHTKQLLQPKVQGPSMVEKLDRLYELKEQEVCCEVVSSGCDRGNPWNLDNITPDTSPKQWQQLTCHYRWGTLTGPHPQTKSYKPLMMLREEELVFPRDELLNWLSHIKWSSIKMYTYRQH